ncbi:MAG: D-glycero-beta-D-manno-heptose 1-phosphate adenylyltransferase [Chitinophagales bacterium]|nr:D-glycero-beta-D-manno-heptose 1-phosphate adenylyltransferase [Chitinophagales bacterium]MCZ2394304.1 D-glycero-beta-D-manno-heptose 1-phosphate adenylyltransferase [Chitinophagales bacterium]
MQINYHNKILKSNISEIFKPLKLQGKKIVFTNGCFDILHKGHIKTLYEARRIGDILVVGINDDVSVRRLKGFTRPILPLDSRVAVLASLEYVDYVIPFSDDTPLEIIKQVRPNVLVKGGDYREDEIVGRELVLKLGGFVKVIDSIQGYSTTDIINKIQKQVKNP